MAALASAQTELTSSKVLRWRATRISAGKARISTVVNMGIHIVQITALLVFAIMAIAYRANHPQGRGDCSS